MKKGEGQQKSIATVYVRALSRK